MTLVPRPVELEIQPSRLLLAWLLAAHFSVFLILLIAPIPLMLSVGLAVVVCLGGYLCIHRWCKQGAQYLGWHHGIWLLRQGQLPGEVELQSYLILPGILQLVFRRAGRCHRLLIYPDSVSSEELRQLRQLLLLGNVSFSEQSHFERRN